MSEQLRIWAGLNGFVSAASLMALALFFVLATPFGAERRQWSWLGPVNDWLSVLGVAPWIVAMLLLAVRVRAPSWFWVATFVVAAGVVVMAVVTLLMLAGRADLSQQAAVALPVTVAAFAWLGVAAYFAGRAAVVPSWVEVLAYALAGALLIGAAIVGVAFALPQASRMPLFVVGGVLGGLAWLGFPAWWLAVASTVR